MPIFINPLFTDADAAQALLILSQSPVGTVSKNSVIQQGGLTGLVVPKFFMGRPIAEKPPSQFRIIRTGNTQEPGYWDK